MMQVSPGPKWKFLFVVAVAQLAFAGGIVLAEEIKEVRLDEPTQAMKEVHRFGNNKLQQMGATFSAAAWSPDGKRIVTGCGDGQVRLWDATTGTLIWKELLAPSDKKDNGSAAFVSFSPDKNSVIVVGRRDDPVTFQYGIVKIFDANNGKVVRESYHKWIRSGALSSDGKLLVVGLSNGGAYDTSLVGIETKSGKILYTNPAEDDRMGFDQVEAIQFQPSSNLLQFASHSGEVILFDAHAGKEKRTFVAEWRSDEQLQAGKPRRPSLWSASFSADGRTLVTSAEQYVYVWDLPAENLRFKMLHPHKMGCEIAVSPDGTMFATADDNYAGDPGTDRIRLYEVETGRPLMKVDPTVGRAGVLLFSPDGTKLFTGFSGGAAVWDVKR